MKGFHNLVLVGVLLVTLLVIIDTIDARKKETKKRETGNRNDYEEQNYNKEKYNKLKKSHKSNKAQTMAFEDGDYNEFSKESLPYTTKKETKKTKRETTENEPKTKTTKTYKKVKKYRIVEDDPLEDVLNRRARSSESSTTSTTMPPRPSRTPEEEQLLDEIRRSIQASIPKRNFTADFIEYFGSTEYKEEQLNRMFDGGYTETEEENTEANPRRRKYRLVEVVLEENQDEGQERNETLEEINIERGEEDEEEKLQSGNERLEDENVNNKLKVNNPSKGPKLKRSIKKGSFVEKDETVDLDNEEIVVTEEPSHYYTSDSRPKVCRRFPEDPNRRGPAKVTLYVVEKILDGKKVKDIIPIEDGVSMCEVAELMSKKYGGNSNINE